MAARLWGRTAAVSAIREVLKRGQRLAGASLFFIAEAGLGKTTLLSRAEELAGDAFQVGRARADAFESSLPFALMSQALPDLGLTLAAAAGPDARAACFYRTMEVIRSGVRPVLLLLDDLHWADRDSLDLLRFLVRRQQHLPLTVIATARPWPETGADLASQLAELASVRQLEPLDAASAEAMLAARTGRPIPPEQLRQALTLTGGNPLLLEHLGGQLEGTGPLSHDGLLAGRFVGWSALEMRYARAASILGNRFRPDIAASLAQMSALDLESALQALSRSGVIRSAGEGWTEFSHPLFRQMVYDGVDPASRQLQHAAAFRLMLAAGITAEEAAEHAVLGQMLGDQPAIEALRQTGEQALARGAIALACDRLTAAVKLAGSAPRAELLLALAGALLAAGSVAQSEPLYRQALADPLVPRPMKVTAHRHLAQALFVSGRGREAEWEQEQAWEAAGDDPALALEPLVDAISTKWFTEGVGPALPLAGRARALAPLAQPVLRRRTEATAGFCDVLGGDGSSWPIIQAAAADARRDPVADMARFGWGLGTLGVAAVAADYLEQYETGEADYLAAARAATELGSPAAIVWLNITYSELLVRMGRLGDAQAALDHAEELIELTPIYAPWLALGRAYLFLELGAWPECIALCSHLAAGLETSSLPLPVLRLWLAYIRGTAELRSGNLAQAVACFHDAERVAEQAGLREPCIAPWAGDALRAYTAARQESDALRVLSWLDQGCRHIPCRWPRAMARAGEAFLASAQGNTQLACTALGNAVDSLGGLNRPLVRAQLELDLGRLLRRSGKPKEAREPLTRALNRVRQAGAAWLEEECASELDAAGGRLSRQSLAQGQLTPQEGRVAELAGQGLSNGEIAERLLISLNTVETHLRHVYDKLGIRSRRDLIVRRSQGQPEVAAPAG